MSGGPTRPPHAPPARPQPPASQLPGALPVAPAPPRPRDFPGRWLRLPSICVRHWAPSRRDGSAPAAAALGIHRRARGRWEPRRPLPVPVPDKAGRAPWPGRSPRCSQPGGPLSLAPVQSEGHPQGRTCRGPSSRCAAPRRDPPELGAPGGLRQHRLLPVVLRAALLQSLRGSGLCHRRSPRSAAPRRGSGFGFEHCSWNPLWGG